MDIYKVEIPITDSHYFSLYFSGKTSPTKNEVLSYLKEKSIEDSKYYNTERFTQCIAILEYIDSLPDINRDKESYFSIAYTLTINKTFTHPYWGKLNIYISRITPYNLNNNTST